MSRGRRKTEYFLSAPLARPSCAVYDDAMHPSHPTPYLTVAPAPWGQIYPQYDCSHIDHADVKKGCVQDTPSASAGVWQQNPETQPYQNQTGQLTNLSNATAAILPPPSHGIFKSCARTSEAPNQQPPTYSTQFVSSVEDYCTAAQKLINNKKKNEARSLVWQGIAHYGHEVRLWRILIQLAGKDVTKLNFIWDLIGDNKVTCYLDLCKPLIHAFLNAEDFARAWSIVCDMRNHADKATLDSQTAQFLLNKCLPHPGVKSVWRIMNAMDEDKTEYDVAIFSTLAEICSKRLKPPPDNRRTHAQVLALVTRTDRKIQQTGIAQNPYVYSTFIEIFSQRGDFTSQWTMFEMMAHARVQGYLGAYKTIIGACIDTENLNRIVTVLMAMQDICTLKDITEVSLEVIRLGLQAKRPLDIAWPAFVLLRKAEGHCTPLLYESLFASLVDLGTDALEPQEAVRTAMRQANMLFEDTDTTFVNTPGLTRRHSDVLPRTLPLMSHMNE